MDRWILRDELLKSLSQWYLVLASIVVGAVLGFGISYLRPAPYQAVKEFYVGIDVKRVNEMEYLIPLAEEEPLNLDDYKNWQLKQVADILVSDNVLLKTLDDLRSQDPYWDKVTLADFRKTLDIYWYDTGVWQLKVSLKDKDQATAGVEAWANAGQEVISGLISSSQQNSEIDQQIWSINLAIKDLKVQRAQIIRFSQKGQDWIPRLEAYTADDSLPADAFEEFSDWVGVYSDGSALWEGILEGFPESGQSAGNFLSWLEDSAGRSTVALDEIEGQMAVLDEERESLLPSYHEYLDASLGLSANLVLRPNSAETNVFRAYHSDTFILGGAFLGLLAWLLFAFSRIRGIKEKHG